MQISALNLIIAAQQARAAQAPVVASKPAEPAGGQFVPTSFPQQDESPSGAPATYSRTAPLGSQIDIRV